MKLKVLAYTFTIPLLLITILLLQFIVPDFPDFGISHFKTSSLLIMMLISSSDRFIKREYLTTLLIDDDKITLNYLTPLAKQRHIIIRFSTLTDIEIKKKIFLLRDFGSIKFFSKDNRMKFYILNSEVKQAAEQLAQTFAERHLPSGR